MWIIGDMQVVPHEPVAYIVIGLATVVLLVLILPFMSKKVERNLEPFFMAMGIIAVTISGLWNWELAKEALKAPVMIGAIPIGIFQVVLIFGLLVHYFNKPFCNGVVSLANKLGPTTFVALLIIALGLISSIVSVIVTACILSEVIAALPFNRSDKIKIVVITCFAVGLGAGLTPLGEPLSTILVQKLGGLPYNAGFLFPMRTFGIYIIPGVVAISAGGALLIGRKVNLKAPEIESEYTETLKTVIMRAVKVYIFVAALILLGEGLKPLIVWYFTKIPAWALYWINSLSAILDNATLTAVEIGPTMAMPQIISAVMALLIAGGMLIPGNIPNIVAAGRLKINMREWAIIGVPIGLVIMVIYFMALIPLIF
jgi:predicted cation transporter